MKKRGQLPDKQKPFFDEEGLFKARIVAPNQSNVLVLPPLPPRLWTFFCRFESLCRLDCCGLSALAFRPPIEWDKRWNFNSEVYNWLEDQLKRAEKIEEDIIRLPEFRQNLYLGDYVFLLRYLMENMEKSKQWK